MRAACLILFFYLTLSIQAQTLNGFTLDNALVNPSDIKKGGPPRNGIPALDHPEFIPAQEASFLNDQELLIGVFLTNEAKAYPINILNWHEIVNDSIGGQPIVVTYCPLCGSGMVFSAFVKEQALSFGVSGLLYNSDVLLYDRQTESLWSQMIAKGITGKNKGKKLTFIPSELTTWKQWKEKYPQTTVLSTHTGYVRNYAINPYNGYEQTEQLYFSVTNTSNLLPAKEQVLGIQIKQSYKAYPFSELAKSQGSITDVFKGVKISIAYNKEAQTAVLESPKNLTASSSYWFAWYAFHPYTKLYKHP